MTIAPTNGWPEVQIGDIAATTRNACVIGPFGSDLKTSDFTDSGVPVVFVQNVRPGQYNASHRRFVSAEKARDLKYHQVLPGDLVITKMGLPPCVATVYPDHEPAAIVTADVIKLTVNSAKADSRYVMHYLNSTYAKQEIARITFGVTRPKVTLADFRKIRISLPPLSKQRRIAAILDKADAIRRKRHQSQERTVELVRSAFFELFGDPIRNTKKWKTEQLGKLAQLDRGRSRHRPRDEPRLYGDKYPFIQTGDVTNSNGSRSRGGVGEI